MACKNKQTVWPMQPNSQTNDSFETINYNEAGPSDRLPNQHDFDPHTELQVPCRYILTSIKFVFLLALPLRRQKYILSLSVYPTVMSLFIFYPHFYRLPLDKLAYPLQFDVKENTMVKSVIFSC